MLAWEVRTLPYHRGRCGWASRAPTAATVLHRGRVFERREVDLEFGAGRGIGPCFLPAADSAENFHDEAALGGGKRCFEKSPDEALPAVNGLEVRLESFAANVGGIAGRVKDCAAHRREFLIARLDRRPGSLRLGFQFLNT